MSKPAQIDYTCVRVEGRRIEQLALMTAHNERAMAVPNADPSVQNRVSSPWSKFTETAAYEAILSRLLVLGVKEPPKSRHIAYEAIFTFSPNAAMLPTAEVLEERVLDFSRRNFTEESMLGWATHLDEGTIHMHVWGIPLCIGRKPGRPKQGQGPKKAVKTVSWTQFCHADKVNRRKPEKAKTKAQKLRAEQPQQARNEWFVHLQTDWAAMWSDHGFRRGIESGRRNRSPKQIRARTDLLEGMADKAKTLILDPTNWLNPSDLALGAFRLDPTRETLAKLVQNDLPEIFEKVLAPLVQAAKAGVQVELEKETNANLDAANKRLKAAAEAAHFERDAAHARSALLAVENAAQNSELEALRPLADRSHLGALADHAASLSDEDFEWLAKARKEVLDERRKYAFKAKAQLPLSAPTPTPAAPTPDLG